MRRIDSWQHYCAVAENQPRPQAQCIKYMQHLQKPYRGEQIHTCWQQGDAVASSCGQDGQPGRRAPGDAAHLGAQVPGAHAAPAAHLPHAHPAIVRARGQPLPCCVHRKAAHLHSTGQVCQQLLRSCSFSGARFWQLRGTFQTKSAVASAPRPIALTSACIFVCC